MRLKRLFPPAILSRPISPLQGRSKSLAAMQFPCDRHACLYGAVFVAAFVMGFAMAWCFGAAASQTSAAALGAEATVAVVVPAIFI
jgi:hypothetical protein